jgi:hypothetical protein
VKYKYKLCYGGFRGRSHFLCMLGYWNDWKTFLPKNTTWKILEGLWGLLWRSNRFEVIYVENLNYNFNMLKKWMTVAINVSSAKLTLYLPISSGNTW